MVSSFGVVVLSALVAALCVQASDVSVSVFLGEKCASSKLGDTFSGGFDECLLFDDQDDADQNAANKQDNAQQEGDGEGQDAEYDNRDLRELYHSATVTKTHSGKFSIALYFKNDNCGVEEEMGDDGMNKQGDGNAQDEEQEYEVIAGKCNSCTATSLGAYVSVRCSAGSSGGSSASTTKRVGVISMLSVGACACVVAAIFLSRKGLASRPNENAPILADRQRVEGGYNADN